MSLEDTIKSSAKFLALTAVNVSAIYGVQQLIGLNNEAFYSTNLIYPSVIGLGLTLTYYIGE